MQDNSFGRREFIGSLASLSTVAALYAQNSTHDSNGMIYRSLGTTGERVSAIGLGGSHIGTQPTEQESIQIIRSAIDRGITFMDNCWDYNVGASEIRMGKALRDGYRQKVFLMTKFDGRNRKTAALQIEESLARLQTGHVDLLQFHENIRMEDPDEFFVTGGAVEALMDAKKAGKTRYVGFTGHKDPAVHLRMLQEAKNRNFHFDTVQMPINVMDAHFRSFLHEVVPVALAQKAGVLGMKPMSSGYILKSNTVTPIECLHFALSQPASVVITGCDSMKILDQAFEAVRTFTPLSQAATAQLLAKTAQAAAHGAFEPFKISNIFDSTAQHPEWLGEELQNVWRKA